MQLTQTSKIVAAPEQVSSELAGESVILNLKTGLYYGLNEVGATIWDHIQSPKTFQEICDVIVAEYDVTPEGCASDIQDLLADMISANLIIVES